jgi:hypothetical protein
VDKVSELIDGDTHQWDLQKLLTNKFSQVDIDRIMQIPISGIAGEDWTAWAYEKSGLFTVKSAYRMLVSQPREQQGRAATSSSNGKEHLWKSLWKLKVVPKVRVFWWRVMRGIMPDFSTLTRRHVRDNSTCSICKSAPEMLLHALAGDLGGRYIVRIMVVTGRTSQSDHGNVVHLVITE